MKSCRLPVLCLLMLLVLALPQCKKSSDSAKSVDLPGDWVQTNGPGNGLVGCVAVIGDNILAGVNGRGMYFTADIGTSWLCDTTAIPNNSTVTAIVPVNDTTVYSISDRLYRSYNKGVKWKAIAGISTTTVSLAVNGSLIVTGTLGTGGISISQDGGMNWTSFTPTTGSYRNAVAILGQDIFDGTSGAGIFYTHDFGQHWEAVNTGLGSLEVHCLTASGSSLYAGTSKGLYSSPDNGQNWNPLNNGLPTDLKVACIAINGSSILIGNTNGIWYSSNMGLSWASVIGNLPVTDIRSLALSGSSFIAGTTAGLFVSNYQGQLWSLKGIPVTTVKSMCTSIPIVFAAAELNTSGVYTTSDHGASWRLLRPQLTARNIATLAFGGGILVAGTDSGVFISQNQGLLWSRRSDGLTNTDVRSVGMIGAHWFAGTYNGGFFRSDDYGNTWNKLSTGVPDNIYVYSIFCQGSTIFAGTYYGGLLISRDLGQTWQINNQMPSNTVISSFASSGSTIYAGTFIGVYKSDDEGQTWLATTLENQVVYSMLIVDNYIFAGVKTWSMYGTTINGSRWWQFCTGLPYMTTVTSLATDGTLIFAGTQGLGIWTHRLR
ncbi:MAG: hypothetical protein NTY96_02660 [Bacteroidetes bacterium]|nr:hypothetical protein [Bacteroidota bacterium]